MTRETPNFINILIDNKYMGVFFSLPFEQAQSVTRDPDSTFNCSESVSSAKLKHLFSGPSRARVGPGSFVFFEFFVDYILNLRRIILQWKVLNRDTWNCHD